MFRTLSKKHHPDRQTGSSEKMKTICQAYQLVKDPVARKILDEDQSIENCFDTVRRAKIIKDNPGIKLVLTYY